MEKKNKIEFMCDIGRVTDIGSRNINLSIETHSTCQKENILKKLSEIGVITSHINKVKIPVKIEVINNGKEK